ncbi:MAG: S-adenosylmethionine synthetase [Candidatus Thermoplasmatota archaeon]|nr:S-adenosylmethionine synthetase [Candidatus Thermoplasmatota archaeon]
MARNILIKENTQTPVEQQSVEFVERKGIGHPDSIADGLAESVSRALCQMYIERYGRVLHHNTDETQIVGGQSAPKFGGGAILEPIYILLVGRATTSVNGERLPYRTTAMKAAYSYLEKTCKNLDVDWDVVLDCMIGQGSVDLRGLYETQRLLANDTSFGVGFAPLSETERITLETERYINGKLWKKMPELGEDIKVMACRNGKDINLTIACAMVSSKVPDKSHYKSVVEELKENVADFAGKYTKRNLKVDVNTADDYKKDIYYLTVSGLSMENGDDGSVGRGNRANGLITPMRPMSMEASAGKNPVTHVGKLYNILSNRVADEIYKVGRGDILEVHARILSQIGRPIDDPQAAYANIIYAPNVDKKKYEREATAVFDEQLKNIYKLTDEIVAGKVGTF